MSSTPVSPATVVLLTAALLATAGVGAVLVELPVVAHGPAKVVSSLPLQPIEPVSGGRVADLRVVEGSRVQADDVIAVVVNLDIRADLAERQVERSVLTVKAARLDAEAADRAFQPPAAAPPEAAEREHALWRSRTAARDAERAALRSELVRAGAERREILARLDSAKRIAELARQRHEFMASKSPATRVQLMDMERDVAEREGVVAELNAAAIRSGSGIEEVEARMAAQEATWRRDILSELAETRAKIDILAETERAAIARLAAEALTTPVMGIVQTIHAGPGRVVAPGSPVVDIVPLTDELLVEARIAPSDVAGLRPGLPAVVRLDALDYRSYGALAGEVVTMSPDSIQDPETGALYYRVRVRTELSAEQQGTMEIIPGMTGTVDIELGRRRVGAYLLRPVERVLERAFRE